MSPLYLFFKDSSKSYFSASLCWIFILLFSTQRAGAQTVNFTVTAINGNFCAPAPVKFTPAFSTQPLDFIWEFGVFSDEFDQDNPTIIYPKPGAYKVTLTALFADTLITAVQNVTIYGLPEFTVQADRNYICQPGNIRFTPQSTQAIASYTWDFGDGTPAVNQPPGIINHSFSNYGNYTVKATATTAAGCSADTLLPVSVRRPNAALISNPKNGCLPANVLLQANVVVPTGTTVTSYKWNFGDGSPSVTNTSNNINHVYTSPSGGKPTLDIVTSEGCTNTLTFDSLFFGTPPQPVVLSTDKTAICYSDSGIFRASSAGANLYFWDFGDNSTLYTSDTVVSHKFSAVSSFKVKVTPYFNFCPATAATLDIIVTGVSANFYQYNRCTERSTYDFLPLPNGNVTGYEWDFGDGTPVSNQSNPVHIFTGAGKYPVKFIVRDSQSNCNDTTNHFVYVQVPKLAPMDSFACINTMVTMQVLDILAPHSLIQFNFLGKILPIYSGFNFAVAVTDPADSSGIFNNSVIVSYEDNCPDTLLPNTPLRVAGPKADFDSPTFICLSDDMTVQNKTTTSFPYDPVVTWAWNFGNGFQMDNKANPSPFKFAKSGRYTSLLTATDSKGCIDSVKKQTVVLPLPFIKVNPASGINCPGDTVELNALHQGKIRWTPAAEVSCDDCASIKVKPLVATIFTATAIGSDTLGCTNSFDVNMDVYKPYNFNHSLRDTGFCSGGSVRLDLGIGGLIYRWSPATGLSNTTVPNPIASPVTSTTYKVDVIDSTGCFPETAQANISVHPLPVITPGPPVVVPYNSTFTLNPVYGPDVVSYQWSPITQLNCTNCPAPTGTALESIKYTVIATTSFGCTASAPVQLFIECSETNILMPTAFTPNGDNLNDFFYPITRGMDTINKFQIYNRFGEKVFERNHFIPNDKNLGWDGRIGGKLPQTGSYIYTLETVCNLGEILSKKGQFMLIR